MDILARLKMAHDLPPLTADSDITVVRRDILALRWVIEDAIKEIERLTAGETTKLQAMLDKIAAHPDTPELIRQYAKGDLFERPQDFNDIKSAVRRGIVGSDTYDLLPKSGSGMSDEMAAMHLAEIK